LLAGIWQLKGIRRKVDKGTSPLCLGEEDAKHILLNFKDTEHWRMKLIYDKLLNANKKVAYRKMVKITNKAHIQNLVKYLDTVKNKWLNKVKEM
jgi:hypothetical protein